MSHAGDPYIKLTAESRGRVREIHVAELSQVRDGLAAFIPLDVRETEEFAGGHLPGAIHVSRGVLETDIVRVVPDRTAPLLCYSGAGHRSAFAADTLQRLGYSNVRSLREGFKGWQAAQLPMTQAENEAHASPALHLKTARGRSGISAVVGRTPLIRLRHLSAATGCEIYGKAEFMNPGGSVKDRTALGLIEDAERSGALAPGGTMVEGTAGNTGIGLALLGNARGYKSLFIVPDNFSLEKTDLLASLGAEVRRVPPKPYSQAENFQHVAKRTAEGIPGAWWANQFDNLANRAIHYRTTGPEIWQQTRGKLTAFVASIGSGGTIAGVSEFLKERDPSVRTVVADPYGAAMWSWFKRGNIDTSDGDSVAEGIGQSRVTKNVESALVDDAYRVSDHIAIEVLYHLLRAEGLYLGLSSAINVAGALRLAKERGPGQVIVTVLCDGGGRYGSRLFNPAWLAEHHLVPRFTGLEFLDHIGQPPVAHP